MTAITSRYASMIHMEVTKFEWRLSFITGKARRTIVVSSAPIRVPRTTIAKTVF